MSLVNQNIGPNTENIVTAINPTLNGKQQHETVQLDAQTNTINMPQDNGKALRQVVAAFIANLGTINTGLAFGFSAVVIPQLQQPDSLIQIDENQKSWIGKKFFLLSIFHFILLFY